MISDLDALPELEAVPIRVDDPGWSVNLANPDWQVPAHAPLHPPPLGMPRLTDRPAAARQVGG